MIHGLVSAAKKKEPQTTRMPSGEILANASSQATIGSVITSAVPDQSWGSSGTRSPGSTNRGLLWKRVRTISSLIEASCLSITSDDLSMLVPNTTAMFRLARRFRKQSHSAAMESSLWATSTTAMTPSDNRNGSIRPGQVKPAKPSSIAASGIELPCLPKASIVASAMAALRHW